MPNSEFDSDEEYTSDSDEDLEISDAKLAALAQENLLSLLHRAISEKGYLNLTEKCLKKLDKEGVELDFISDFSLIDAAAINQYYPIFHIVAEDFLRRAKTASECSEKVMYVLDDILAHSVNLKDLETARDAVIAGANLIHVHHNHDYSVMHAPDYFAQNLLLTAIRPYSKVEDGIATIYLPNHEKFAITDADSVTKALCLILQDREQQRLDDGYKPFCTISRESKFREFIQRMTADETSPLHHSEIANSLFFKADHDFFATNYTNIIITSEKLTENPNLLEKIKAVIESSKDVLVLDLQDFLLSLLLTHRDGSSLLYPVKESQKYLPSPVLLALFPAFTENAEFLSDKRVSEFEKQAFVTMLLGSSSDNLPKIFHLKAEEMLRSFIENEEKNDSELLDNTAEYLKKVPGNAVFHAKGSTSWSHNPYNRNRN